MNGAAYFTRPKGLELGAHVLNVTYDCPCGAHWSDSWDSACDDECGECGRTIEASAWDSDPDCDCAACEAEREAPAPVYRVLITPAAGRPAFLLTPRRGAGIYLPHDGAPLERPDEFMAFETPSRNWAEAAAEIVNGRPGGLCRAELMQWSGDRT